MPLTDQNTDNHDLPAFPVDGNIFNIISSHELITVAACINTVGNMGVIAVVTKILDIILLLYDK